MSELWSWTSGTWAVTSTLFEIVPTRRGISTVICEPTVIVTPWRVSELKPVAVIEISYDPGSRFTVV